MHNSEYFLQRYADNADEHARFFASARAATAQHAELSEIAQLKETISTIADGDFESMLPHFQQFLAGETVRRYFQDEVHCSLASDIYQAQAQSIDNEVMQGLQIIDADKFAVAVVATDPTAIAHKKKRNRDKPTSVMMSPKDTLVRFLRAGGARISVYSCAALDDSNPASTDSTCELAHEIDVSDGDTLLLRAGQDSFSFNSATSVVCFAQAYAKDARASVMPEFDSRSLKLIGLSATNDKSSRIQMMTTVMRLFGHREAFDAARPFLDHQDYFVRWYVMRELLAIDPDRAFPLLGELAQQDSHPQVRAVAHKTLTLFNRPLN